MRGDISAAQGCERKSNSRHRLFKARICLPHMVHNWEFFPFKGNCIQFCLFHSSSGFVTIPQVF